MIAIIVPLAFIAVFMLIQYIYSPTKK